MVTIPSGTYSISAEDDNGNPIPVGVVLYGSGASESYGFPAGLQLAAINVNIPYCSSTIYFHMLFQIPMVSFLSTFKYCCKIVNMFIATEKSIIKKFYIARKLPVYIISSYHYAMTMSGK